MTIIFQLICNTMSLKLKVPILKSYQMGRPSNKMKIALKRFNSNFNWTKIYQRNSN